MGRSSGHGVLFVISAPSGTGKSTVAQAVLERRPDLEFSVSHTTRARREGEQDGREYHFVEREAFRRMVDERRFLEWAAVFDQFYGTGLESTREALDAGRNLLLDIDVQGARQIREQGEPCVSIMLLPPDYETLESRLRHRGSESEATRLRRLSDARKEVADYRFFDYVVVNADLQQAVTDVVSIVQAEFHRATRSEVRVNEIIATFPE